MYAASQKFFDVLRDSHRSYAYVDLYFNNALTQSRVPIVSGSVTVDRTQNVRRSLAAVLGDPSLFPKYVQSPIAPYGAELYVYKGIEYLDGTTESIPLGVFTLETVDFEESVGQSSGGLPQITAFDRSQVLARDNFLVPVDYSGWTTFNAIKQLVRVALPLAQIVFSSALLNPVLPGGTTFTSDRLGAVQTLCAGIGAEAYFDVSGVMQVVPIPAITQSNVAAGLINAVWTVDASTPEAIAAGASLKGVLIQAARGISRTGAYNGIAVYGNGSTSSSQPYGQAFDTDPRSPTFWGGPNLTSLPGPYGHVTQQIQVQTVTTDAQAVVAAQAQLNNSLGLSRSLSFTMADNPALEAGDFLKLIYSDGTTELQLLDSFAVPLDIATAMTATTRTSTYQQSAGT